jgi:hypothetical protein
MREKTLLPAAAIAAVMLLGIGTLYWRMAEAARQATEIEQEQAELERQRIAQQLPRIVTPTSADRDKLAADLALVQGVTYLAKRQSPDGAWRSDVYATFKDGPALTPLVVWAMQQAVVPQADTAVFRRKGCEYLAKMVRPDGTIDAGDFGLDYPVYTAALTVIVLSQEVSRDPKGSTALLKDRDAWLKYLLERQLTEALGWKPEDKEYGGWGYCRVVPRKLPPNTIGPSLIESNLSATVFALEAVKAAGVTDKAVYEKALVFVRRCQNDDGGFFFIYDDPVRNKAGSPDPPTERPTRFHSYGSTTADGLRALMLCDEPQKDRIDKAKAWLVQHATFDRHPGQYVEAAAPNRDAVYYYYAASVAQALRQAEVKEAGGKPWAPALAAELLKRQKDDGSWANPVELVRENDPVVATSSALIALAHCKAQLK